MTETIKSDYGLENHGITQPGRVYWNLSVPALYEEAIRRGEGILAQGGPLVVRTGIHTGRAPKDKFIVREPSSEANIWWGDVNRPITEENFEALHKLVLEHFRGRDLFVRDCYVGADPRYRLPIRIITEKAWASIFASNMFRRPSDEELAHHVPEFVVLHAPECYDQNYRRHNLHSSTFVLIHFGRKLIVIGGTSYAGEIKKSVFTIMNYLLPMRGVLPMHCSANIGEDGDVALFFGLSGTGKTTLSADPHRSLIGDDEHGWSDDGVFNFEGGCYAKVIRLSPTGEPEIYATTSRFGTILENVIVDEATRQIDLDDATLTENTRASYPIHFIPNAALDGRGGHPRNVVMLTADAFGVMPPIARLTPEQAVYHFLSGYTAKVAGTERGLGSEPQATFSTCFGAPFMVQDPIVYAELLRKKVAEHNTRVWLLNTGWSGGPYGVGKRMELAYTRAMVRAALRGVLDDVPTRRDPIFGLHVPTHVPDVPDHVLDPRGTWADPEAYDKKAKELAGLFLANFEQFADRVGEEILRAGPQPDRT